MNLLEVKKRFSEFVDSFEGRQSVELMMQYVELALSEYNANPHLFLESARLAVKFDGKEEEGGGGDGGGGGGGMRRSMTASKINLLAVKMRFARLVCSFEPPDVDLLMEYAELAVYEFNIDACKFLACLKIGIKMETTNDEQFVKQSTFTECSLKTAENEATTHAQKEETTATATTCSDNLPLPEMTTAIDNSEQTEANDNVDMSQLEHSYCDRPISTAAAAAAAADDDDTQMEANADEPATADCADCTVTQLDETTMLPQQQQQQQPAKRLRLSFSYSTVRLTRMPQEQVDRLMCNDELPTVKLEAGEQSDTSHAHRHRRSQSTSSSSTAGHQQQDSEWSASAQSASDPPTAARANQTTTTTSDAKLFHCFLKNCDAKFVKRHTRDNHSQQHKDGELRPYGCNICKHTFVKMGYLSRHLRTHHQQHQHQEQQHN